MDLKTATVAPTLVEDVDPLSLTAIVHEVTANSVGLQTKTPSMAHAIGVALVIFHHNVQTEIHLLSVCATLPTLLRVISPQAPTHGFLTSVPMLTSRLILPAWTILARTRVMTIYMSVTVRVFLFSTLVPLVSSHQTKLFSSQTSYTFHTSQNNFFQFKNFV